MIPIPQEINYLSLLSNIQCENWRHLIVGAKQASPTDDTPTAILTFQVPANLAWVVTQVSLRSIPAPDDAQLTVGDWRSFDYDASGTARAYWQVNGSSVVSQNTSYFALLNRPCLFAFAGANTVTLIIERFAGAVPTDEIIVVAANGYLTMPDAVDKLARNVTQIKANYS